MRKIILFMLITLYSAYAFAKQDYVVGGGFAGPTAAAQVITVEQAKTMSDDTMVILQGNVIQHIGGDNYIFSDSTGSINMDIDHKLWLGQVITPDDKVEVRGKVDRDWNSIEIDAKQITKMK